MIESENNYERLPIGDIEDDSACRRTSFAHIWEWTRLRDDLEEEAKIEAISILTSSDLDQLNCFSVRNFSRVQPNRSKSKHPRDKRDLVTGVSFFEPVLFCSCHSRVEILAPHPRDTSSSRHLSSWYAPLPFYCIHSTYPYHQFYSETILSRRGPLGKVWLAAHMERKLSKTQTLQTDIEQSVGKYL